MAEINKAEYRQINNTPFVELAPLPSSAQFLNIIESVFSGMAKAIIHNSTYQSVDECKIAIDSILTKGIKPSLKPQSELARTFGGKK